MQMCVVAHVEVDALVVVAVTVALSIVELVVVATVVHALATVKAVLDAPPGVVVHVLVIVLSSVKVAPMAALVDVSPLLLQ